MTKAGELPTEHEEQAAFVTWLMLQYSHIPFFAVPNGSHLAHGAMSYNKLKVEGFKAGVPDLFICLPNQGWHGLFIEMKRREGGRLSKEQEEWLIRLSQAGYCCRVCNGFIEAQEAFMEYVKNYKLEGQRK